MKKINLVNLASVLILICENCFCLHVNSVSSYDRDKAASTLNLQPVNSKINTEIQKFKCPRCNISEVYRSGKFKGIQRYRCKKCHTYIPLKKTEVQEVKCPRCDGSDLYRKGKNSTNKPLYKCKTCNRSFVLGADPVKQNSRFKENDSRIYLNAIFSGEKNIFVNYLSSNKEDLIKLEKERQKRDKNIVAYYKYLDGMCIYGSRKHYMQKKYKEVAEYFGYNENIGFIALRNMDAQFDEIEAKDIKAEVDEIIKNYGQHRTENEFNHYLTDVVMRLGDIGFSCYRIVELLGLEEERNIYLKKSFTCLKSNNIQTRNSKIRDTITKEEDARVQLNYILPKEKQILPMLSKLKKEKRITEERQKRLNNIASYYNQLTVILDIEQSEAYKKIGDCLGYKKDSVCQILRGFPKDQLEKIEAKDIKGKADEIIKYYEQHRDRGEESRVCLTDAIIGLKDLGFVNWRIVELLGIEKEKSKSFSSTSNLQPENFQSNIENTEVQEVKCPICCGRDLNHKNYRDNIRYVCKTCGKFFTLNAVSNRQRKQSIEGDSRKYLNSILSNGMYINRNSTKPGEREKNIIAYYKQLGGIRMAGRVRYIAEIYKKVANYFGYSIMKVVDMLNNFQFDNVKEKDIKAETDEIIKNYKQHKIDNESNLDLADAIMSLRGIGFTCARIVELLGLEKEKERFFDEFRTHSVNSADNNEVFDLENLIGDEETSIESESPKKIMEIALQEHQISTNDEATLRAEKDESKKQSDDESMDQEELPSMLQASETEDVTSFNEEVKNQPLLEVKKESSILYEQALSSNIVKQEIKKEPSNLEEQALSSNIVKQYPYDEQLYKSVKNLKGYKNLKEEEFKIVIDEDQNLYEESGYSKGICRNIHKYIRQFYMLSQRRRKILEKAISKRKELDMKKIKVGALDQNIPENEELNSIIREGDYRKSKGGVFALIQNKQFRLILRTIIGQNKTNIMKEEKVKTMKGVEPSSRIWSILTNIEKEEGRKIKVEDKDSSTNQIEILSNTDSENKKKRKINKSSSNQNEVIEISSGTESENESLVKGKKRRIKKEG